MIELEMAFGIGSDCTSAYNVKLDKLYTIQEITTEILNKSSNTNEFGTIRINKNDDISEYVECEYYKGKLLNNFSDKYLKREVFKITSSGGWGRMDYLITLK